LLPMRIQRGCFRSEDISRIKYDLITVQNKAIHFDFLNFTQHNN
jgi:hypothetical protein